MFYLNTIEQLFLFVEQLDQLEVCLPYSRLLTGIPILAVFQNLRWNSNSLCDCKSLSLYFGRKLRNWILEENSWVWKIWTEEEWEVEVKIWTTLTYHKVEWGYRSESDKIMLKKISKVVMYECVYDDTWREGKEKVLKINVYML